jgi:sulfatase maturation enzyme AslB (radical SAM superfamily)
MSDTLQDFKILSTIRYSDILSANGDSILYNWLQSNYKEKYENLERLQVIQDAPDVFDVFEFPGIVLQKLQQFVADADIDHTFILIDTADIDVENDINTVAKTFTKNDLFTNKMGVRIMPNLPLFDRVYEKADTFCALPWVHFFTSPGGLVLPCCTADSKVIMGNMSHTPIIDVMNSDRFVTLRSRMLTDRRSRECSFCYRREKEGLESPRQEANKKWKLDRSKLCNTIETFAPQYIDIRLTNVCNLKCRMCDAFFSSSIANEVKEIYGLVEPNYVYGTRKKNIETILSCLNTVEKIYFAGGEPLQMPEHYRIIDELIAIGNTNIEIKYNTNFTKLVYKGRDVIDLWSNFTNVTVGASLDACGRVAEYVRHGTKWEDIISNYERFRVHAKHVNFLITSTVQFTTVASLIELQRTWHEKYDMPLDTFCLTVLQQPNHLSVRVLPAHHKARLTDLIQDHQNWAMSKGSERLVNSWQDVLTYMNSKDDSYLLRNFQNTTKALDNHRRESFTDVLPEYSDLL